MKWTPLALYHFFPSYSQTLYRLFFYLVIHNCVPHTWHMKDTWILPLPLCQSSSNCIHAFIYKHFLLQVVFPKLVKLVQFPYVIYVYCLNYPIWTSLLYNCFAFCFQFLLYTLSQNINMFHDVVTFICTFWFLIRIVLDILYLYIQHTITWHLQYNRHINFQK